MIKRFFHIFISILIASILTNAVVWAFSGEVFNHAIESEHHVLSLDPDAHSKAHQLDPSIDHNGSSTADLCIHAAGQYLPFFLYTTLSVSASEEKEDLLFIPVIYPEIILDSPLRPPKPFFANNIQSI